MTSISTVLHAGLSAHKADRMRMMVTMIIRRIKVLLFLESIVKGFGLQGLRSAKALTSAGLVVLTTTKMYMIWG